MDVGEGAGGGVGGDAAVPKVEAKPRKRAATDAQQRARRLAKALYCKFARGAGDGRMLTGKLGGGNFAAKEKGEGIQLTASMTRSPVPPTHQHHATSSRGRYLPTYLPKQGPSAKFRLPSAGGHSYGSLDGENGRPRAALPPSVRCLRSCEPGWWGAAVSSEHQACRLSKEEPCMN